MKGKFGVLDLLVILLLVGSFYVYSNKEAYFEIKSGDIYGASATYYTLREKGYCADVEAKGYLETGEVSVVAGKVIDSTRTKLYVFDGEKVWVVGGEEIAVSPRLSTGEVIPADLFPLTITMRAVECEQASEALDADFEGLKSAKGFLSFHGVVESGASDAEAFWLMRKVAEKVSGEVYVWKDGAVLHVYAKHIVPGDVLVVEEYIPGLLVSDVVSTQVR